MALSSIRTARFRSFLTMFGVIVGVASVVTITSLGEGIKQQVAGQTNAVGSDLITVRPGKIVKRDAQGEINGVNLISFLSANNLSDKDIESIKKNPLIETTVPLSVIAGVPAYENDRYEDGFIMATTEDMPQVINRKTDFGNFFDKSQSDRNTAVIGINVAEKLFKENVPVGKTFQLRGQNFIVAGVFERFPVNPLNPELDYNNGVFIPYNAGKTLAGGELKPYEIRIHPKDKSPAGVDAAIGSITNSIKQNHDQQEDFTVLKQGELVSVAASVVSLLSKIVGAVAAVALLAGGIGIMNVMLVTVTERTREIGIRKAVGATNHQIRMQFLTEAIIISAWGALIGLFLSVIINIVLRITTNLEPIISWQIALGVTLVSIATGIIFGTIPAVKASLKHPIESLRRF